MVLYKGAALLPGIGTVDHDPPRRIAPLYSVQELTLRDTSEVSRIPYVPTRIAQSIEKLHISNI